MRHHLLRLLLATLLAVSMPAVLAKSATAAAARATTVSLDLRPSVIALGSSTRASGTASGGVTRTVDLQQRRADGTWRTLATRLTSTTGAYAFTMKPASVSTRVLRVRARATSRLPAGASATRTLKVVPENLGTNTLASGRSILPGQFLRSADGRWRLRLRRDGSLSLNDTAGGTVAWATSAAAGVQRATMRTDGNLAVAASTGTTWSTGTHGFTGARLVVRNDGNVVVARSSVPAWTRREGYVGNRLREGQRLEVGDFLLSADRRFRFVMQGDGNLVEYGPNGAVWASSTSGSGGFVGLQGDGNLVVYIGGTARWAANTAGFPGVELVVQDDGNVVSYSQGLPVWASRDGYLGGRLSSGWRLDAGDVRLSPNHRYRLVMQGDGNLVQYDGGTALWSSATSGNNYAIMQGDGNLVVYRVGGGAQWASGTAGHPGARLEVQSDDNLVIYEGATALWARKGLGSGTAPADWKCYSAYNQACVSRFGYAGQSTWGYPTDQWGNNCTNYAAFRLAGNGAGNPGNLGNAIDWDNNAAVKGFGVNQTPARGSIAQWNTGTYGHVAYVDWVSADGNQIAVSESGYHLSSSTPSSTGRRILTRGQNGWPSTFLHIKDL
jgi:surface antigen